jgi:ubiquinone/menaquinone biosynthesis C-methylase UbiE
VLHSREEFNDFFEGYAGNVEGFYEATYWELADAVIKELIQRHLGVSPGAHVLDAGGGTGRWACWCAKTLGVRVTVADKSPSMLAEAARLVADAGLVGQVDLVECDLHDAPELEDVAFDGIVSTYGVLSFLDDPARAYETFARVLKPGARGLVMGHSFSNALASKVNRDHAGIAELRELFETRVVRWSDAVPPLRVFSTGDLADLASGSGLSHERCFGVTTIAAPGPEDFGYPYTSLSDISARLTDDSWFREVLGLELAAAEIDAWSERGTNLMQLFRKPE